MAFTFILEVVCDYIVKLEILQIIHLLKFKKESMSMNKILYFLEGIWVIVFLCVTLVKLISGNYHLNCWDYMSIIGINGLTIIIYIIEKNMPEEQRVKSVFQFIKKFLNK